MVVPADMVVLDNLTVSYRQHPALHHLRGCFASGSLTAVMGPNGSGKSTLLKTIVGLLRPAGGRVVVHVPRERVAYLPQLAEIDRNFPLSVLDCVAFGLWNTVGAMGKVGHDQRGRVLAALREVGLAGFEQRTLGSLSGGQLQRVLFARLSVQEADLVLLDEPFHAMDSRTTTALLAQIHRWHGRGTTVIAVLHDEGMVRSHFPQTVLLARELVAWGATTEVLTQPHLERSRLLAEAWDDQADICHSDDSLPMASPSSPSHLHSNPPPSWSAP